MSQPGPGRLARRRLTDAFKVNPYVPDLLIGREEMPDLWPESYAPGEASEAIHVFSEIAETWLQVKGSAAWLETRWDQGQRDAWT
jgi:hypothetical protein